MERPILVSWTERRPHTHGGHRLCWRGRDVFWQVGQQWPVSDALRDEDEVEQVDDAVLVDVVDGERRVELDGPTERPREENEIDDAVLAIVVEVRSLLACLSRCVFGAGGGFGGARCGGLRGLCGGLSVGVALSGPCDGLGGLLGSLRRALRRVTSSGGGVARLVLRALRRQRGGGVGRVLGFDGVRLGG